ncbi:CdiA family toxin C-terminal domain-containing protein [Lysinibacillus sp. FSL W7-1291]|uniref:CdiA family toxin C-terminal domain-containing protein n=1 Tax=Lysinibacillus sp. FSL W7-1291 TaxID=2954544 RepID=UPI0031599D4B
MDKNRITSEAELKALLDEHRKTRVIGSDGEPITTLIDKRKVLSAESTATPDGLAPYVVLGSKMSYALFIEDYLKLSDANAPIKENFEAGLSLINPVRKVKKGEEALESIKNMEKVIEETYGLANNSKKAKDAQTTQKEIDQLGEYVKKLDKGTVKDVTFKKGYDTHLTEVEGFKAKPNIGIKGGHNLENFEQFILDNFGNQVKDINQAVTKTSHPDISGIYEVKYKLPVYDGLSKENGGKGNFTGQWKEYKNPKTVYDPKVFSDEQILKLGREAMEEGISNNRIIQGGDRSPSDMVEGYVNVNGKQLKFMGFKDKNTGEISNFFPVLD